MLARAGGGDAQQFGIFRLQCGAQFDAERLTLRREQERIFGGRAREQPFIHARHEHAAESHAARLFDAAHPDLAVARIFGRSGKRSQPRANHQQHVSQAHRTDGTHGLEFLDKRGDALRLAQGEGGQLGERGDPLAPGGAFGKGGQAADHGQGEGAQVLHAHDAPLQARALAFVFLLAIAAMQFLAEAVEARFPAFGAADDRGVHQQALPGGGCARFLVVGHLAKREILRETRSGEALFGAVQQGEEAAPGDVGAARTARAVDPNSGAAQAFHDQRLVALRRADRDGDLVEGHASVHRRGDAAGDLHALQGFAGGGKDLDAAIFVARRDGVATEEVALQRFEARLWRRLRRRVAGREAQVEVGAGGMQNEGEQFALRAGARRQIKRHHGLFAKLLLGSQARQVDARGVVGEAARGQLVLVGAEQQRQVRARFAALVELGKRHGVEAQFLKGVGEGARKSRESGDGPEVSQSAGGDRLLRDARGEGFADDAAHRHERAAIQLGGGEFQDQFAECQAVHADERIAASHESDFVGGLADRRQHQHRPLQGHVLEQLAGPAGGARLRAGIEPQ